MAQKTWGPFTGKHLTVIVCTLIVMLLLPVGAWAVNGSNVFVTDASTGARGKVDSKGGQNVAIHDSGNATAAKVNAEGQLLVGPTSPGATIVGFASNAALTALPQVIQSTPTNKAMIVTSVILSWTGADPASDPLADIFVGNNNCSAQVGHAEITVDLPSAQDFRSIDFPQGWPVPANDSICGALDQGTASVFPSVMGYSTTSSAVPVPAAAPISASARHHR